MTTIRTLFAVATILLFCHGSFGQDIKLIDPYLDSAANYEAFNKNKQAYSFASKALKLIEIFQANDLAKLARVEGNLGTYAYRMGDIALSQIHHRKAIHYAQSMKKPNYECIYLSSNNMGSIMWFASKMDSALYYFGQAMESLKKMDTTPLNKYYRPAVLQNNLAGIYGVQGKTSQGIAAMKSTISSLRLFLQTPDSTLKLDNARHLQFEAIDNLAGIYKELGDYRQAQNLLTYSYLQKQKVLGIGDVDVSKSEILLGQLFYAMRDHEKAKTYLNKGIAAFKNADGDYLFWQADGYNTLALIADDAEKHTEATVYYEKADSLYEQSLGGEYDNIYLEFLTNASTFYAKIKAQKTAIQKARKGYNYILATEGEKSLSGFYQLLNLGDVYYQLGDYKNAKEYSNKAVNALNALTGTSSTLLDSIKMEIKKPKAILLLSKSQYRLLPSPNPQNLAPIVHQLREALTVLERRKTIIHDVNDINLLMDDHKDLIDFIKKITAELYQLTGNPSYIDTLVTVHESGLYNRIRSRLDSKQTVQFANLPLQVQSSEKKLKEELATAMQASGSHNAIIQRYVKAEEQWNSFLQFLQRNYPEYYKMRYGTIFYSLDQVMKELPEATTIVRYIFAGQELLAFVGDRQHRKLYRLQAQGIGAAIESATRNTAAPQAICDTLHKLYNQLWAPLTNSIKHKRVIIIPDGILFNLNFELLTPQQISDFSAFSNASLLTRHVISYRYSLFLLNPPVSNPAIDNNFIAFTPGFSDRIKAAYLKNSESSIVRDNFYLSLLPQPFTIDLAQKMQSLFGGTIYAEEKSTVSTFRKTASGHRIIHIGTHAEADNLHPQFSRLIFSKDINNSELDNSLYLFDIYNCQLTSRLTVLTACESGKVGYEDGEGMVSLAHAFNYAGSESILMGLSKIDEQSCAEIISNFYRNLQEGLSKDDALQQAKISYLKTHGGRSLAPPYWAGLVIMGDTAPIELSENKIFFYLIAAAIILFSVSIILYLRKRAASGKKLPEINRESING